jgi:hypothetical protein
MKDRFISESKSTHHIEIMKMESIDLSTFKELANIGDEDR